MQRRDFLAIAASALGAQAFAVPSYQPRVLAHLCNWHRYRGGSSWREASVLPLAGPYDSRDPATLVRQFGEMKPAGIGPLASWWGEDADEFFDMLVSVPDAWVPSALLYEGAARLRAVDGGWYDFSDPRNCQQLADDVYRFHERYFSRYPERFFRHNGRFVIMLWPSHVYRGPFAAVGEELMRRLPVFLVSTDLLTRPFVRPDAADLAPGFGAVSAYGLYLPEIVRELGGRLNRVWLDRWQAMADTWDRWLDVNAPQTGIVLPLEFAYDDSRIWPPRGNLPLETDYEVVDEMLARARAMTEFSALRGGRYLPWYTLKSFNEWFEGSGVEPSERHGRRFLDSIARAFA